ncbi:MAG: sodium-dependent transporter [Synergistaceae bacterium]|jgi:NSS family neurotransmitter:Na+ symporter|nr:sodium-dependent transporter [Synergistaceae bacterium]
MDSKNTGNAFSSVYGFLITAIGFAVGVGSIWRFPFVLGENGGALFLIAYVAIIVVIGAPLLTAEIAMGFKTQKTAVMAYKDLAPGKMWFLSGYAHLAAGVLIISYTLPIYAWILKYLVATVSGVFAEMTPDEIKSFFGTFIADHGQVAMFAVVNVAINAAIVSGGVKTGVERVTKILLPMLGVIMLILIVAGLSLPGSGEGVRFLIHPDPSKFTLGSLQTALGQAFFAIGIAMLASLVFGSYIKNPSENIGKCSVVICAALVCAGMMAGFMIFPVLFASGIAPAAGPGLTFIALPNVFTRISGGRILGALFYVGFYIAAVTSSAGVAESVVGQLMDQYSMSRKKALAVTISIMTVIGMICVFNDAVFNAIDLIENNYLLTLGALCIAIFVGWVWGIDNFIEAANIKSDFSKMWLRLTVKYVSPVAILFIFISSLY